MKLLKPRLINHVYALNQSHFSALKLQPVYSQQAACSLRLEVLVEWRLQIDTPVIG